MIVKGDKGRYNHLRRERRQRYIHNSFLATHAQERVRLGEKMATSEAPSSSPLSPTDMVNPRHDIKSNKDQGWRCPSPKTLIPTSDPENAQRVARCRGVVSGCGWGDVVIRWSQKLGVEGNENTNDVTAGKIPSHHKHHTRVCPCPRLCRTTPPGQGENNRETKVTGPMPMTKFGTLFSRIP